MQKRKIISKVRDIQDIIPGKVQYTSSDMLLNPQTHNYTFTLYDAEQIYCAKYTELYSKTDAHITKNKTSEIHVEVLSPPAKNRITHFNAC